LDAGEDSKSIDYDGMALLMPAQSLKRSSNFGLKVGSQSTLTRIAFCKTAISKDWDRVDVGCYRFHGKLRPWVLPGKAAIAAFQKIYVGPCTEASTGVRSPYSLKRFSKMLFESALKREKGTKITA
jgi:hypothetical protein